MWASNLFPDGAENNQYLELLKVHLARGDDGKSIRTVTMNNDRDPNDLLTISNSAVESETSNHKTHKHTPKSRTH